MDLDGATLLLQWAAGGLLFGWVTTRRREAGLGYGWMLRITFGLLALAAVLLYVDTAPSPGRNVALAGALLTVAGATLALTVSVVRRKAGASGQVELRRRRRARVRAMLGQEETVDAPNGQPRAEFPPALDLVAPVCGFVGLLGAAELAGGPYALAAVRIVIGAAFLGAVTDAMLLGHWYLVQPGLRRDPLDQLVTFVALLWPFEVAAFLWPTGMVQVFTGVVDDGYQGLLGWVWAVSALTTIGLVIATRYALRERYYSAVMAATGLLYLAILTAFGTDLVARAVLAP